MHNSTHYPIQTAGSAARGGHVPMGCDRCGYEGGVGLAVKAKGQDNTPKDTPARETVLRLYAGRREMALANVLGSTSRAAPILRAVASSTALRFTLRVTRDARGPGERAGGSRSSPMALSLLSSVTTCTCWPPSLVPPLRAPDTGRCERP